MFNYLKNSFRKFEYFTFGSLQSVSNPQYFSFPVHSSSLAITNRLIV